MRYSAPLRQALAQPSARLQLEQVAAAVVQRCNVLCFQLRSAPWKLTSECLQGLLYEEDACELAYVHNAGLTAPTAAKQQGLQYGEQFDARLYEYFQKVRS